MAIPPRSKLYISKGLKAMANRRGGGGMEIVTDFSWAPKSQQMLTAAMKLKNTLLLGRKAMKNLDSILKSRDITLLTKVHIGKAMVFPVVIHGCVSWTIKAAEQ